LLAPVTRAVFDSSGRVTLRDLSGGNATADCCGFIRRIFLSDAAAERNSTITGCGQSSVEDNCGLIERAMKKRPVRQFHGAQLAVITERREPGPAFSRSRW